MAGLWRQFVALPRRYQAAVLAVVLVFVAAAFPTQPPSLGDERAFSPAVREPSPLLANSSRIVIALEALEFVCPASFVSGGTRWRCGKGPQDIDTGLPAEYVDIVDAYGSAFDYAKGSVQEDAAKALQALGVRAYYTASTGTWVVASGATRPR